MNNETMRIKFDEYYIRFHKPNLQSISTEIGIDKSYLINWKNGKYDISTDKLKLIDKFINRYKTL